MFKSNVACASSDVCILSPTESCRCQEQLGLVNHTIPYFIRVLILQAIMLCKKLVVWLQRISGSYMANNSRGKAFAVH